MLASLTTLVATIMGSACANGTHDKSGEEAVVVEKHVASAGAHGKRAGGKLEAEHNELKERYEILAKEHAEQATQIETLQGLTEQLMTAAEHVQGSQGSRAKDDDETDEDGDISTDQARWMRDRIAELEGQVVALGGQPAAKSRSVLAEQASDSDTASSDPRRQSDAPEAFAATAAGRTCWESPSFAPIAGQVGDDAMYACAARHFSVATDDDAGGSYAGASSSRNSTSERHTSRSDPYARQRTTGAGWAVCASARAPRSCSGHALPSQWEVCSARAPRSYSASHAAADGVYLIDADLDRDGRAAFIDRDRVIGVSTMACSSRSPRPTSRCLPQPAPSRMSGSSPTPTSHGSVVIGGTSVGIGGGRAPCGAPLRVPPEVPASKGRLSRELLATRAVPGTGLDALTRQERMGGA